jgi:CDP-diacylglycerol--serine O-phosphatidyltransferase
LAEQSKRQRFSMVREYTLADTFTIGNAACGTVSIFLCLQYLAEDVRQYLWLAFVLIPAAFVLDGFDGWVARKRNSWSAIGADMDSLADIVSFGVAPAALGYTLGMRGGWDIAILVYFVVCGISRLARYNVTAEALADETTGKVKYFEGTPIPTSLALVAVLGVAFGIDAVHAHMWLGDYRAIWVLHPLSMMYLISGSLMISTIRIPKP